ncbi:unnamed protein product [Fusarium langsethiae]|nr:unnamed protein product [Fusarium langsethiae]
MALTPPSLGYLPVRAVQESQPRPTMTKTKIKTNNAYSKEKLPSMEEILTKLGLGKDGNKAVRRSFMVLRSEAFKEYLNAHEIAEETPTDWSKEECRSILRQIAYYFLHDKGGSTFWSEPPRKNSRYIFSKDGDRKIILGLITKHFYLYANDSTRRKAQKPLMRRKFLQGNGDSFECAIDIDNLSDDGVPPVQESSIDHVPKGESLPDNSEIDQDMMPQHQTYVPKQSAKRPAEAELPQTQSRAKSLRLDARGSSVGLPSNGTEEEESLFLEDDEPIYDPLVDCKSSATKQENSIHECAGIQADPPAAENAEPSILRLLEEINARDAGQNIQNNLPKDSAPDARSSIHDAIVCVPLRQKVVTHSPYNRSRSVLEKETDKTPKAGTNVVRKKTKTAAVLRFESRLDSPKYVPEQTYLPPLIRDISVPSETMAIDLTLDGIPGDSFPDISSTTIPPAIKDTDLLISDDIDIKDTIARSTPDKTTELPCNKALKDPWKNENPYQSIFKMALSPPEKELHFDSEHAEKLLNDHLRNHAKATSTPIRFSFSLRHSSSHANRFKFSPFTFFTMSLREFVTALPIENKDQISGLCIRQYGSTICLRQVYLYNKEVFGNIRDEFIGHVEGDIRDAKCTGKTLDYEISIEPIMDDY